LKKYPVMDLKTVAKKECNIDRTFDPSLQIKIIESSKRLRQEYNINEKNVCFNCSKKMQCKYFEKLPEKGERATPLDLQIVMSGLYSITSTDLPIQQLLTGETSTGHLTRDSDTTGFKYTDPVLARFSNRDWNSANILMEINLETFDDLLNHQGVSFKALVNAYIESQAASVEIVDSIKETPKEMTKEDLIVKLVEDLNMSKNRKEKRTLLAKYNKEVGIGFGEYRKINTKKIFDNEEEEVDNKRKPGSREKKGGFELSQKRVGDIEKYSKKQLTQKFSQKIDFKKQKAKALEGQQNLSLMMNEQTEDRSLVNIPGKDYKRGLYLATDKDEYRKAVGDKK
jgi:hypothetical protein